MTTIDITGATLIDATDGPVRRNASLRIAGDRIAAVWEGEAKPEAARAPADRTINAAGKTVMPGMIDAHCHISYGEGRSAEEIDVYGGCEWAAVRAVWNASKVLAAGVTSFCDPGSTWNVAVTVRDAIANGMFPGPKVFAAGRHIAADGGFADYFPSWTGMPVSAEGVLCPTRDDMVREVRRQVKNRVDLIKISGDSQAQERLDDAGACFSDEEMKLIVDTGRKLGRKVTIHARYAETVLTAARARVDWLIHASYMRRQDLGFIRDTNIPICPTLAFTANIVEWGKDVGVDPNYIETKKRELAALGDIHRRAHEMGVVFMAGSESGFSVTPYGEWHAREIELMVELLGMSPLDAIRTGTRNNARAFGWDAEVGTLQAGKRADVLIVDGDPLGNIRVLSDKSRMTVIQSGEILDRAALERAPRRRMGHERGFVVAARHLHLADVRPH